MGNPRLYGKRKFVKTIDCQLILLIFFIVNGVRTVAQTPSQTPRTDKNTPILTTVELPPELSQPAKRYRKSHGQLLRKIPLPTSDPVGLALGERSIIYYTDWGRPAQIICFDYLKKRVIWKVNSPDPNPMGIAYDGNNLWIVGKKNKTIYKLSLQRKKIIEEYYLGNCSPQGITFFNNDLWVSDLDAPVIRKISPESGQVIETLKAPDTGVFGLAWDGKYLWCAMSDETLVPMDIQRQDWICSVYPRKVTGGRFCGLDYRKGALYMMAGKQNPRSMLIYRLPENGEQARIKNLGRAIFLRMDSYVNNTNNNLDKTFGYVFRPSTEYAQDIIKYELSGATKDLDQDIYGNLFAKFKFPRLAPNDYFSFYSRITCQRYDVAQVFYPHIAGSIDNIDSNIGKLYLCDHPCLDIHNPVVQKHAKMASGNEKNAFWLARNIVYHLSECMENYGHQIPGYHGGAPAPPILESGNGGCREITRAFVAIARACGLPARHVRCDWHSWAEVYLPGCNQWMSVDMKWHIDFEKPGTRRRYRSWAWNQCSVISYKGSDLVTSITDDNQTYITRPFETTPDMDVEVLLPKPWFDLHSNLNHSGQNYRDHLDFYKNGRIKNINGQSSPAHAGAILAMRLGQSSTVRLFWDPALTWNNGPVKYDVYLHEKAWNCVSHRWPEEAFKASISDTFFDFENLEIDKKYYANILAKNTNGFQTAPWWQILEFTLESLPVFKTTQIVDHKAK